MSTEHPLRVQVASALGWTDLREVESLDGRVNWVGVDPHGKLTIVVPRYDSSWCSTGVLFDRYSIGLSRGFAAGDAVNKWLAFGGSPLNPTVGRGVTPTEAISDLIVQLSKEGKLPK